MQLANDLKRALGRKRSQPSRANGFAARIKKGEAKLSHLWGLKNLARCSIVYLTSGGNYEESSNLTARMGVQKSIEHAGYDKHDFARKMGYKDFYYVASMLEKGTIPVKVLLRFASELKMEIWELLCDGECYELNYPNLPPSHWDQMVELNIMGWLDSKRRDQYKEDKGPGL